MVDDRARMQWRPDDQVETLKVRFRTLGCWPVTAASPSAADTVEAVALETFCAGHSEREGRLGDGGSLERHKRDGYF